MPVGEEKNLAGTPEMETLPGKEQTPEEDQTFTREQVQAAVAKAKSDAKADIGRLETEWKRSQSIAENALARLKALDDENYRRAEESARDDPDELSRIRKRRQEAVREAEVSEKESKIQTQLAKLVGITAKVLSEQYNVSEEILMKYGSDDLDDMEGLARSYGERKEAAPQSKTRMTQEPDSGETKGGSGKLTIADVKKMSPEEQNRRRSEIAKLSLAAS